MLVKLNSSELPFVGVGGSVHPRLHCCGRYSFLNIHLFPCSPYSDLLIHRSFLKLCCEGLV